MTDEEIRQLLEQQQQLIIEQRDALSQLHGQVHQLEQRNLAADVARAETNPPWLQSYTEDEIDTLLDEINAVAPVRKLGGQGRELMDRRFPPITLSPFLDAACASHNVKYKAELEAVNRQNQQVFTGLRNLAIIRAVGYENNEKDILRRFLEKEQKLHVALIVQEQEKLIEQLVTRIVKELGLAETLAPLARQALSDDNAEAKFNTLAQAAFDAKARLAENKRLVESLQRNRSSNYNQHQGNGRGRGRGRGNHQQRGGYQPRQQQQQRSQQQQQQQQQQQ